LNLYAYADDDPLATTDPHGNAGLKQVVAGFAKGLARGLGSAVVKPVELLQSAVRDPAGTVRREAQRSAASGSDPYLNAMASGAERGLEIAEAPLEKRAAMIAEVAGEAVGETALALLLGARGGRAGRGPQSCFLAGTPVVTPEGWQAIEQIRPGDLVLALDSHTGLIAANEVSNVLHAWAEDLLQVRLAGAILALTATHPVWVVGKGWVEAGDLTPGDLLLSTSFGGVPVVQVRRVSGRVAVFNLEVSGPSTFFVSGAEILVHNKAMAAGGGRTWLGRFLRGRDVAEAGEHADSVGTVTGVVDRSGARARRAANLKGKERVPGKDLDEYPPAVIKPDDPGQVSVKPIDRSQNRRSGARLRDELPPDGTPVVIEPPTGQGSQGGG
jgi:hypothetical protein